MTQSAIPGSPCWSLPGKSNYEKRDKTMLKILGLSLSALFVLAGIITMIVINLRDHRASKKSIANPNEAKGPFTRPSAPANPGRVAIRTSRDPDHIHMRSGTIYERTRSHDPFESIRQSYSGVGASMNEVSRSIHEALGQSPAAPGVVVRVTGEVNQQPGASPERVAQERFIPESDLDLVSTYDMLRARRENQKTPPVVQRVSRYKRKPVI